MTLTVSELAALLTEAVSRIGTWQERAEWLLPRLWGESVSDDLAAKVPASGPAATTHHGQGVIPYRGPSVGESVLPREEAAEIAAARALFEWDAKHMDTECRTWDEILAKGYDKGYRECARAMIDAMRGVPAVDAGEKL